MSEWDTQQQGRKYEGYAFTFCKAAFLTLIFQKYALFALSGLATIFYVLAALKGVKTWRCWAKPPWVTLFWACICAWQFWTLFVQPPAQRVPWLHSAMQASGTPLIAARWQEAAGTPPTSESARRATNAPLSDTTSHSQTGTGTVLIAGGGTTSPALVKAFLEAAGGEDAPILILPQTEADPVAGGPESVALFRENGAKQVEAPAVIMPGELCKRLGEARGVWIPGGDQNRFMTIFPESSGVPEAIRQVFRRGGVVGGTSAGASLMGEKMPTGEVAQTNGLQSGGCPLADGLKLLPKTIVDQHFFARNRMQRLLTATLDQPGYTSLGVEEGGYVVARNHIYRAQNRQALVIQVPTKVRKTQEYFGADKIEMRLLLPNDQIRY